MALGSSTPSRWSLTAFIKQNCLAPLCRPTVCFVAASFGAFVSRFALPMLPVPSRACLCWLVGQLAEHGTTCRRLYGKHCVCVKSEGARGGNPGALGVHPPQSSAHSPALTSHSFTTAYLQLRGQAHPLGCGAGGGGGGAPRAWPTRCRAAANAGSLRRARAAERSTAGRAGGAPQPRVGVRFGGLLKIPWGGLFAGLLFY